MNNAVKQFRLSKMVEEIEDYAILLLDENGNIENWNKGAEKIKGYKASEIIGKNFRLFYTDEDRENLKPESLIETAKTKGKAISEGWRVRKDGSQFWGSIVITAIHDEQGSIVGFTKVTRDLTDKMLAAEAIQQHLKELQLKNKELEQFVYIASHDLQEPLLTVSSFVELFKEEYGHLFDGDGQLYMEYINQATSRMRNLIKDLLDYSHIGRENGIRKVDVNGLLANIVSDLDQRIAVTGAQIIYGQMPSVTAYATELRQLFQNLIINALKFYRKDVPPVIEISAEPFKKGWRFNVSDNGIGIEPQHEEKIFLIFQRLHNREEFSGNGIGLANCKKIAVMHNGDISVKSVPGKGSVFSFTIAL
ncbi:ATP-binding protein [Mucilaginibacter sp. CSA2-8R]|uniref:sensor histidine kinase n=1 Tax=Mucilaginibacter sp. CSA2-8R TaxID=3141542 RepID=UPI00315C53B3